MDDEARHVILLESLAILANDPESGYDVVGVLETLVERCRTVFDVSEAGILTSHDG